MAEISELAEIIVSANVVTGRIEVETSDWADDDPRWDVLFTPDGARADAAGVEPWAEDEESMDRATRAVREILGFTVTGWQERPDQSGEIKFATVTGRP